MSHLEPEPQAADADQKAGDLKIRHDALYDLELGGEPIFMQEWLHRLQTIYNEMKAAGLIDLPEEPT